MRQTRAELKVGDVLKSGELEYKIQKVINKGGMATVYVAEENYPLLLKPGEPVALKSFKEVESWDKDTQEGLKREAYTWVTLGRHPNIVEAKQVIIFYGKTYIVMEYVEGGDLGEWIERGGVDIVRSLDLAIQFCNGMEYAYEAMKMVHRDIKPGNMLITRDGTLKVTDFGVAATTGYQEFLGLTPPYASPEQFLEVMPDEFLARIGEQRKTPDTRSDIYSFGVVFYEMLTGKLPFSGNTMEEWAYLHIEQLARRPSLLNPRLPPKFDHLVMRCLAKDRTYRHKDFGTLKEDLMSLYVETTGTRYELPQTGEETGAEEWTVKGENFWMLNRFDDAIDCYDQALEIDPGFAQALGNKGQVFSDLRRYDEALPWFNRSLEIDPQNDAVWSNKGLALKRLERYAEAIRCYDRALAINRKANQAWVLKGSAFVSLGKYRKAIKCCNKALKIDARVEFAWNNKGLALTNLGHYEKAIKCYDKALEISPQHVTTWNNKGQIYLLEKRYDEAIRCYDKVLEIDPQFFLAWYNKGIVLGDLKRYDEAINCYDKALEISPEDGDSWNDKGWAYSNLGRYEEAIRCYDKALGIAPEYVNAWNNKGFALDELTRYEEAIECYDKALEINPKFKPARNNREITKQNLRGR